MEGISKSTAEVRYNDRVSAYFAWAAMGWGLVGMLVGVIVALQMSVWQLNLGEWLSFGRLRPLHTNAVIFAFVGNMLFSGVYYSTQRLLKTRMASDTLSWFHFWGWQAIIVSAAITLPLGITQSKEYAELEWPIDIAIAVVWVAFAVNFFWTLKRRNERQLYVALWFYIATIVTITVLHVVNNLAIPTSLTKSYPLFGGVQGALVQWWYGHNAVAFFLTTPILGIMYYFLPKAAERPVFSYRLSIIHFWALVFIYIWAGPHHLLYTALPEWAQTLGMIFSLMLWAPSWGGMLNGLLTLRGAWDKVRKDPVLKFFAAAVTFYGMATFEGPLLSIRSVSSLAHYTDWIIGHVHSGALGWNGFMAAGMFYWMIPRLYKTPLRSTAAANAHFYIGTFGILLYVVSMWVAGVTQGLMWRAESESGGLLYVSFLETLLALQPMYWTRMLGGALYLVGFAVMAWNLVSTARQGKLQEDSITVAKPAQVAEPHWPRIVFGLPVVGTVLVLVLVIGAGFADFIPGTLLLTLTVAACFLLGTLLWRGNKEEPWHQRVERRAGLFSLLTVGAVLVGGVVEIVPVLIASPATAAVGKNIPYTPLEVAGRDVYLAEGCYLCHSQMIRPFVWETARYGEVSRAEESAFDHPFQWGSKRTGPDLARVGGKYSHLWHWRHMIDPRSIAPGSNMPGYAHLAERTIDLGKLDRRLSALRLAGVPYRTPHIEGATRDAEAQAAVIVQALKAESVQGVQANAKLVALIAYLQRLGSFEQNLPWWERAEGPWFGATAESAGPPNAAEQSAPPQPEAMRDGPSLKVAATETH